MDEMARQKHDQEIRKSKVRVWVTYIMTAAYALAALGLIAWLMQQGQDGTGDRSFFGRGLHERLHHRVLVRIARLGPDPRQEPIVSKGAPPQPRHRPSKEAKRHRASRDGGSRSPCRSGGRDS